MGFNVEGHGLPVHKKTKGRSDDRKPRHALSSPALRRRCCAGSVDVTRPCNRARLMADAIYGLGPYGYIAAMDAVAQMAKKG
jgi:hypothetical protein